MLYVYYPKTCFGGRHSRENVLRIRQKPIPGTHVMPTGLPPKLKTRSTRSRPQRETNRPPTTGRWHPGTLVRVPKTVRRGNTIVFRRRRRPNDFNAIVIARLGRVRLRRLKRCENRSVVRTFRHIFHMSVSFETVFVKIYGIIVLNYDNYCFFFFTKL